MRENFQNIDGKKLEIVHEIKSAYDEGKISLEEARKALKDRVQHLAPYEIAIIEQEMVEETEDECIKEDIQAMLEVFQDVLVTKDQELPENHPISCYRRENAKMKELLLSVEDLVQYPLIKNQWLELYEDLLKFKIHLSRKQNQLYPVLEKKGFTRPTTTMWTLDDFIRDEISECYNLLLEDKEEEFIGKQAELVADVRYLNSFSVGSLTYIIFICVLSALHLASKKGVRYFTLGLVMLVVVTSFNICQKFLKLLR